MDTSEHEHICKFCVNFFQHYIEKGIKFHPINCGHCRKKVKYRKPYDSCPHYTEKPVTTSCETEMTIKKLLKKISGQLKEISVYLKSGYTL